MSYHRVPGGQNDLLIAFENLEEILWSERLGHNDLIDESLLPISSDNELDEREDLLLKPLIAHDEVTLVTAAISPRVLHLIPYWVPICV